MERAQEAGIGGERIINDPPHHARGRRGIIQLRLSPAPQARATRWQTNRRFVGGRFDEKYWRFWPMSLMSKLRLVNQEHGDASNLFEKWDGTFIYYTSCFVSVRRSRIKTAIFDSWCL
jgi:hypothetical protein